VHCALQCNVEQVEHPGYFRLGCGVDAVAAGGAHAVGHDEGDGDRRPGGPDSWHRQGRTTLSSMSSISSGACGPVLRLTPAVASNWAPVRVFSVGSGRRRFDLAGRSGVIRLLRTGPAFESHVCRGALPRMPARAPLFRAIRKNGNLSETALSGASVHAAIRRHA
jgi:hypothetical protein